MSALRAGSQHMRSLRQLARAQIPKAQWQPLTFSKVNARPLTTAGETSKVEAEATNEAVVQLQNEIKALELSQEASSSSSKGLVPPPEKPLDGVVHVRAFPASPSYFTRQPRFNDALVELTALFERYQKLPTLPPDEVPPQLWKTLDGYRLYTGEPVKALPYSKVLHMVKRLHQIHPKIMPGEVKKVLEGFKRDINPFLNVAKEIKLDKFGRALGVGRRKESTARAWVIEGTGEVQINGKPLSQAFGRIHDRESVVWALKSTERIDKYNVWALVEGGGTTGQAEALTLAISKALMAHEPALKPTLRAAGCITRDKRVVERKKHGHVKARKMPAWVKR
ncbi:37S ribosomal protein S9 like [Verticillium longisporum]|uniref:Small ribosomal subunit protein uS9m n=1 Tax=Verticillium longisporum TaxID=100787 RepID=A0A8I3ANW9_VERLO|nr:37S ribosomal protein S9 like [Verticillium longisporum]KAG7127813.1 37S ribosomal protein S9 like [Verticillium longisporum]